jgi:hypothetical protein
MGLHHRAYFITEGRFGSGSRGRFSGRTTMDHQQRKCEDAHRDKDFFHDSWFEKPMYEKKEFPGGFSGKLYDTFIY